MQENNKTQIKKKSLIKTVVTGFKTWVSMISGKGKPQETQMNQQKQQTEVVPQEDSVKEDIKKARAFIKKNLKIFGQKAAPTVEKGVQISHKAEEKAKEVVDVSFTRMVVRIVFVLVFILLFVFVLTRILRTVKENGNQNISTSDGGVEPTVAPYLPTNPSVYAEDKQILSIEEETKVLLNEIIGKKLEEKSLLFPSMDLKIRL